MSSIKNPGIQSPKLYYSVGSLVKVCLLLCFSCTLTYLYYFSLWWEKNMMTVLSDSTLLPICKWVRVHVKTPRLNPSAAADMDRISGYFPSIKLYYFCLFVNYYWEYVDKINFNNFNYSYRATDRKRLTLPHLSFILHSLPCWVQFSWSEVSVTLKIGFQERHLSWAWSSWSNKLLNTPSE